MKKITLLITLFLLAFTQMFAQEQGVIITGTVTEKATGDGIPGATVQVKGLKGIGTMTDDFGNYTLTVPSGGTTLIFSYVGLMTQEEEIGNKTVINVQLKPEEVEIEGVTIVAYGEKDPEAITGAVSTMGKEKIEDVPVANFDAILQGNNAGVTAIANSGRPGSASTVTIRGIGSLSSGTGPLYIVDGVPVGSYDFSSLNPNNIEKVSILKDASAAALYGSRAANGVILITTKRGSKTDRSTINYRGTFGFGTNTTDNFSMMNTDQKINYELALGLRDTSGFGAAGVDTVQRWKSVKTNWRDVYFRRAAMQSHEVSSMGGSEKTKYFISTGYYYQEGTLQRSDFSRWNGQLNLDHMVSDRLKFGNTLTIGWEKNNLSEASGGNSASVQNPVFAAYLSNPYENPYLPDGTKPEKYNTYPFGMNPYREITLNDNYDSQLKMVASLFGEYKITDNISFKSTVGLDFYDYQSADYLSPLSYSGINATPGGQGSITQGFSQKKLIVNSNVARYSKTYKNKHSVDFLIGSETLKESYNSFSVEAINFASEKLRTISSASEANSSGGGITEIAMLSYFSSFSYGLSDKYYADLSFRRDGSSKFGINNRYANFWSTGLKWIAKKEKLFKNVSFLDDLNFRLSVGTSGNSEIGAYNSEGNYFYGGSYFGQPASYPDLPSDPDLTWEQSFAANLGLEFGIFKRLSGKLEFYHRGSDRLFLTQPLSSTTGFGGQLRNIAKMYNRGIETTLDYAIMKKKDFAWTASVNFAYNVNRVVKLYGDKKEINSTGSYTTLRVDEPIGAFWIVQFAGVNPANGLPLWYDANGNISNAYDENSLANVMETKSGRRITSLAPFNGGFSTNVSYKGFNLNTFFTFTQGNYILNNLRYFTESNGIFGAQNQDVLMLDYWKKPGDITSVQAPIQDNQFDTRLLEEGSFLRLRELSLSYNVPQSTIDRMKGINSMRIFARGHNVWTYTKYQGFDPEFQGNIQLNQYPAIRVFTIGLDLTI